MHLRIMIKKEVIIGIMYISITILILVVLILFRADSQVIVIIEEGLIIGVNLMTSTVNDLIKLIIVILIKHPYHFIDLLYLLFLLLINIVFSYFHMHSFITIVLIIMLTITS